MVMRVGGIMSGLDVEAMVNKLMEAERIPLNRLKQQQTLLEWKRDRYREINTKLLQFESLITEMKLTRTYNPKRAISSQESAVRATAASTALNGSYEIAVSQLATNEMQVFNLNAEVDINDLSAYEGTYEFYTFDENGDPTKHTFRINNGDTLEQVIARINSDNSNNIRMFLDRSNPDAPRVVLETTRTGVYNTQKHQEYGTSEVYFDSENNFFNGILQLEQTKTAQNAKFKYNDYLEFESRDNNYTINGVTFEFLNVTEGNARISVTTDVEQAFDTIMKFVNTYNEVIEAMNQSQTEQRYRDYLPLLDEQKEEMTEKQIELWEEKAKSGILRGETAIRDGMNTLRQSLQGKIETDGVFTVLSQIGITTSRNYLDGGKLEVDEDKLKKALQENPEDVYKLFVNNSEGNSRGLIHRFEDAFNQTKSRIERLAGRSYHTLDNYEIGKSIKRLNERIEDFEKRMIRVEQRYWRDFTALETALARMSSQADYLLSQFGAY